MNIRKFSFLFVFILLIYFLFQNFQNEPIENLMIDTGTGVDIKETSEDIVYYGVTFATYVFDESNNITSEVYTTFGPTISINREKRQLLANKKFITGFEKVYILSESYGYYGIKTLIDILQKNPWINEKGYMTICKGSAEDLLRLQIKGYPSSADYIEGLLKASISANFFPKMYTLMNAIKLVDTEGYNLVLPYISIKNNKVELNGLCIFKGDKIIGKLNMDDAKILNILRETKVSGIFELQESSSKYISYEAVSKRKVICTKNNEGYIFTINLNLNGQIISNELYNNITKDLSKKKQFEKDMSKKITDLCYNFIYEMQNHYKVDLLNLGSVAAAKYGRHTGTDWNEVVSKSNINLNVKVNINKFGKGDY